MDLYTVSASHFAYGPLATRLPVRQDAIELQPENPQNSWIRGAIA
jgi:hypothetical protein